MERPSFFHYFSQPIEDEDDEDDEEEEEEKEEKERIKLTEEEDFEVAHAIRTALSPDAVLWFTGEAIDDDDLDEDEEEDDDDDEGKNVFLVPNFRQITSHHINILLDVVY
jgi:nucleosome assembly protein 1-like 1